LYLLKHWYFPLSRLWAAARAADGNVEESIKQLPLEQPSKSQRKVIARALHQFDARPHEGFFDRTVMATLFLRRASCGQQSTTHR